MNNFYAALFLVTLIAVCGVVLVQGTDRQAALTLGSNRQAMLEQASDLTADAKWNIQERN